MNETRAKFAREALKNRKPTTVVEALLLENLDFNSDDVMEEFMVFFLAGTDTTALMLQVMIY